MPFQLNAFSLMTNGINGFLTIGGWSPTRSERLNEMWEMACDNQGNCNDWMIKAYFDQSRQPPLVSMWIPGSLVPSNCQTGLSRTAILNEFEGLVRQNETSEVFFNGQWHPICGHSFWDNSHGAELFCHQLG